MSIYRLKGTSGALLNQAFPLAEELTVGGAGCDIALGDVEAGTLAIVRLEESGSVVIRATGGDVAVNGDPVQELSLAGGDELRIGGQRFILQAPGLRPERVLTETATAPSRATWPWWLAAALVAGGTALAWQQGWLAGLLAQFGAGS